MTHEERQEALEAARILESDVFRSVFDKLEERYVQAWKSSGDAMKREDMWQAVRALESVRKEIFSMLQCAAVKEHGKDEALNAALLAAKGKK